ncbi:uncharacterized protein LOC111642100 [Centruroides sculpturatus]|uniref:uncharacterized protein LOC111642100 n=1 Tax=Centruroides sculpturatus TaxID=218467 RepID=UPI000C6D5434|nr:uncharacterized protein LOC111642100 [Centruroides sculpturatus]
MSYVTEALFNAWIQLMNQPQLRLFCTWHVDQAWRRNLNKICIIEKQAETYLKLQVLLQERDQDAFYLLADEIMRKLKEDPDTIDFATYFANVYMKNPTSWAYCHRKWSGLNTNAHLERMHMTLKYIYLHAKNVKRLDKAINAIMKFVKDKTFDRLIVLHKGKVTTKLRDLKCHKLSENLSLQVLEQEDGWIVESSSQRELYHIEEVTKDCKCQTVCVLCKACIYHFTCTGLDSNIHWNMCKHIHTVCRYLQTKALQQFPTKHKENEQHINTELQYELLNSSSAEMIDERLIIFYDKRKEVIIARR